MYQCVRGISRQLRLLLLCGCIITTAQAQRIVNVPQGVGTLNTAVNGDTLATGARVDVNTVYVLARGGVYLTSGEIQNKYPLTIVAAAGAGARPRIYPAVVSGALSSRPFRPLGDLTLRGVAVSNRDELGGLLDNTIRANRDSIRIVVDSCFFDEDAQAVIRLDTKLCRVLMTNCTVGRIGTMASIDNGRVVDDRGNVVDTLIMENNMIYNVTSRIIRDGGMPINYLRFNHNTVIGVPQRASMFGQVVVGRVTNNLWVNWAFLGIDTSSNLSGSEAITLDTLVGNAPQTVVVKWNNFSIDPSIKSLWPTTPVLRRERPIFAAYRWALIGKDTNSLWREPVAFKAGPPQPTEITQGYFATPRVLPLWVNTGAPYDFSYPTTSVLYTSAEGGYPLGSLVPFPAKYESWKSNPSSSVRLTQDATPAAFSLSPNYPNPFNPRTQFVYELGADAFVSVTVYNVMGQEVAVLVNERQQAGSYQAAWDGSGAGSGIYFCTMKAGAFTMTRKMMLVK